MSLFWYFYSLARYEKVVFSGIGLSLWRHRREEYIKVSFKESWKGASRRWFLVDMHVQPQWVNMYLLPPLINKKRGEPKMTPRLAALVKWVVELHDSSLRTRHCAEEFTLRWIRPLSHRWIQAVSLLLVKFSTLPLISDDLSFWSDNFLVSYSSNSSWDRSVRDALVW
jgi:hypothetical protein